MKRLFSIVDVRRGEIPVTVLMALNIFLLLVTYYFLKPARNALFLARAGSDQLPYVFMLIAVVVVPITTLYAQASRKLPLNRLINLTTVTLIVNLFILRWLIEFPSTWVVYTFYIWVSIYGILVTSQFWLLANGVFDATQAKRLFVLFGLAAILGASVGGEITGLLSKTFRVSIENQLFFCAAFLGVSIVLVNAAWKRRLSDPKPRQSRKAPDKESPLDAFRALKKSRYLMLIVGVIAITMAVSSFTDYQFQTVAAQHYLKSDKSDEAAFNAEKQELGAFMGRFFGRVSLLSFLFQFLLAYRFIRFLGVGGVVLFLPFGLLLGSTVMLVIPGLLAGILLRGSDGVLKYSTDKTARELLFLPVPFDLKAKTKVFIDVFVDRWFRGLSGALLALLVALNFGVREMAIVVIVMLGVWIFLALMVKREYVNAFRAALERRQIDPADLRINIAEAATIDTLRAALASKNERQIVYALDLMSGVADDELADTIRPLLRHPSVDVRRKAVRSLRAHARGDFTSEMKSLLTDDDPAVRRDAMEYLCYEADGGRVAAAQDYLSHEDPAVRVAAVACIGALGSDAERRLVNDEIVESLAASDSVAVRAQLAAAIGGDARFHEHVRKLIDDPSPEVAASAMEAAGRSGNRDFVPYLFEKIGERRYRLAARRGLVAYGDRIVGAATDYIVDPQVDMTVKLGMIRLLQEVASQPAVDGLIQTLDRVDSATRHQAIKALNKVRAKDSSRRFTHPLLRTLLVDELRSFFAMFNVRHLLAKRDVAGLLDRALAEAIETRRERVFRLLQLRYPPDDIHGAYVGIVSEDKQLRASAIEFMDNLLKRDLKRLVIPAIDNIPDEARRRRGEDLFELGIDNEADALLYLLESDDAWLRACAVYTVRGDLPDDLRAAVEKLRDDPHPVVRESVELALSR
jgi:AAA family ATP:ADP antiporter